jgi:hypothetical protein
MGCPSEVIFNDTLYFSVATHDPDDGVLTDDDAFPTYRIYEDEHASLVASGNMVKLDDLNTTGAYTIGVACTAANGFIQENTYTIYIEGTVGGDTGGMMYSFKLIAPPGGDPLAVYVNKQGADGNDGTSPQRAKLTAAAGFALLSATKTRIIFGPGTFDCAGQISLTARDCTIVGDGRGTILTQNADGNATLALGAHHYRIEQCTITNTSSGGNGDGVSVAGALSLNMDHVAISGTGYGLYGTGNNEYFRLHNMTLVGPKGAVHVSLKDVNSYFELLNFSANAVGHTGSSNHAIEVNNGRVVLVNGALRVTTDTSNGSALRLTPSAPGGAILANVHLEAVVTGSGVTAVGIMCIGDYVHAVGCRIRTSSAAGTASDVVNSGGKLVLTGCDYDQDKTTGTIVNADGEGVAAFWKGNTLIDGTTPQEHARYTGAFAAGKVSGAGTGTETFKGLDGSTDRIEFTTDPTGNRTGVNLDP